MNHPINLKEKFGLFHEQWTPKIIAELNGQQLKLAKLEGEFVWHAHAEEDELFWVVRGTLQIAFREGLKTIRAGEILVVPKGVEHKPIAQEEVWVVLFEPAATKHTGEVEDERTVKDLEWI